MAKSSETGAPPLCLSGPVAKIIRKDILGSIRFPEEITLGEDTCFCLCVVAQAETVAYMADCLYVRRCRAGSLSSTRPDTAERLAQYTNWVVERYGGDGYFRKAVHDLAGSNLYCVMSDYSAAGEDYRAWRGYVSAYKRAQRTRLTARDVLRMPFSKRMRLVVLLDRFHLDRVAYAYLRRGR